MHAADGRRRSAQAVEVLIDVPASPPPTSTSCSRQRAADRGAQAARDLRAQDAAFTWPNARSGGSRARSGLDGAFDAGRATASLVNGELRVVLPRITDRRGHQIRIPIPLACASSSSGIFRENRGREIARRAVPASSSASRSTSSSPTRELRGRLRRHGDIADTILGYGVDAMTTGTTSGTRRKCSTTFHASRAAAARELPGGVAGRGSYVGKTRTGESVA